MPQENGVRTVERALHIINCFIDCKGGLSLAEIAKAIALTPSTTLRLVGTLQRENYLFRDPNNLKYYLGFKLAQVGSAAFANLDVAQVAQPYLERLVALFGESTGVYLRQGDRRVCVSRVDGTQSLRSIVPIGHSAPLVLGAAGRVLLAEMDPKAVLRLCEPAAACNAELLEKTRQQGYAISFGEREAGVVSVAAPIRNCKGEAFAALFITGPSGRIDESAAQKMAPEVIACARDISRILGCPTCEA